MVRVEKCCGFVLFWGLKSLGFFGYNKKVKESDCYKEKKERKKEMERTQVERRERNDSGSRSSGGERRNGELKFLGEFGVVLCVKCGCCVVPDVVNGHFRDGKLHIRVKKKRIKEIMS